MKKSVQANRIYLAVKSLITLYYVIWLAPCGASFVSFSSTNDAKGDKDVRKNSHAVRHSSEPIGEEISGFYGSKNYQLMLEFLVGIGWSVLAILMVQKFL